MSYIPEPRRTGALGGSFNQPLGAFRPTGTAPEMGSVQLPNGMVIPAGQLQPLLEDLVAQATAQKNPGLGLDPNAPSGIRLPELDGLAPQVVNTEGRGFGQQPPPMAANMGPAPTDGQPLADNRWPVQRGMEGAMEAGGDAVDWAKKKAMDAYFNIMSTQAGRDVGGAANATGAALGDAAQYGVDNVLAPAARAAQSITGGIADTGQKLATYVTPGGGDPFAAPPPSPEQFAGVNMDGTSGPTTGVGAYKAPAPGLMATNTGGLAAPVADPATASVAPVATASGQPVGAALGGILTPPPPQVAPKGAAAATPAIKGIDGVEAPEGKSFLDQMMDVLDSGTTVTDQQKSDDKAWALLEAGLQTMVAASQPGATGLGAIGRGAMGGIKSYRDTQNLRRKTAMDTQNQKLAVLKLASDMNNSAQTLDLKRAELAEKRRNNMVTQKDLRDYRTADIAVKKQREMVEMAKVLTTGGIKSEKGLWDLAKTQANAMESSYEVGQFSIDGFPVKNPARHSKNVQEAAERLSKRYGVSITPPNSVDGSAATAEQQSAPVVPKSQADIDSAPSGTVFIINGKKMVKP